MFLYQAFRFICKKDEPEYYQSTDPVLHEELGCRNESFFRDQVLEEETYRILMNAVQKLPGQTQNVMLLALEEKDNKEIVFSLSTVHTLKKIAYKRLREEFYCPY